MELTDIKEAAVAGFVAICAIVTYIFKRKKGNSIPEEQNEGLAQSGNHNQKNEQQSNSGTIISGSGHNISISSKDELKNMKGPNERTKSDIREKSHILFIDDQLYTITKLLGRNGWRNVKLVKDVNRIDDNDVMDADVILVDIVGVGESMGFPDQGLGLAKALKTEYGNSKKIVIYSQEEKGDRFHPALNQADMCVKKSTSVYELESILFDLMGANNK